MRTRTILAAAVLLAAGTLLGELVASGRLVPDADDHENAEAGPDDGTPSPASLQYCLVGPHGVVVHLHR